MKFDQGQASATGERKISNARHTVGDGDGGKARAIPERLVSYFGHAVWYGNACQAGAILKHTASNAGHAVRNVVFCDFITFTVYQLNWFTYFISN